MWGAQWLFDSGRSHLCHENLRLKRTSLEIGAGAGGLDNVLVVVGAGEDEGSVTSDSVTNESVTGEDSD